MVPVSDLGLGFRVHSSSALVIAVRGPAASPVVVHREQVRLIDDPALEEPYHAAVGRPLDEAAALIASVEETATARAASVIGGFAESLGAVAAVGVVGGNRTVPTDLARVLTKHALLHAGERALYERALVAGAGRAGLAVSTLPATGSLLDEASAAVGVPLVPVLTALGKAVGPPWQKDHREAAAAALVALAAHA
jgi:hypothetical protein